MGKINQLFRPGKSRSWLISGVNIPSSPVIFWPDCWAFAASFKESLQNAEIPAAQGRAVIFRSRKRLKNDEKSKIAFCFFRVLLSQDDLCRASLNRISPTSFNPLLHGIKDWHRISNTPYADRQ